MTQHSLQRLTLSTLVVLAFAIIATVWSTTISSKSATTAHVQSNLQQGYEEIVDHVLVVPYYNLAAGLTSTLILTNQAPTKADVTVTLYSLDGKRLDSPLLTLKPRSTEAFSLSDWATAAPFLTGSLKIRYKGQVRQVSAVVKVLHEEHSLMFEHQAVEPKEYFKSSRLEGVWWLPSEKAEMSIVVSNNGPNRVSAVIKLHGRQREIGSDEISLDPWESKIIAAGSVVPKRDIPNVGGASVNHTGSPGAVLSSILIAEPLTGFSSVLELRDPELAASSRLDGAGLRIGRVANEQLKQIAVARNVGDETSVLTGRINYSTSEGVNGVIPISDVTMQPGETAKVDLLTAIKKARLGDVAVAGVEFEYTTKPGSIVVSALSVSESGNHVFRVPLIDVKAEASNTGKYVLRIGDDSSTVVYLKNATTETQKYTLQIAYPGGTYVQGLKGVAAGSTILVDLKSLRDAQVPDQNGNLIPLNVTEGYLDWSARATKYTQSGAMLAPQDRVMIGRSESTDVKHATSWTATYGCSCMPSFMQGWIEYKKPGGQWQTGGINLYVGQTAQVRAMEQDHDCFWNPLEPWNAGYPGSQNDPVATFAPNYNDVLTAKSAGNADIQAYWDVQYWYMFYDCCWFQSDYTIASTTALVTGVTISGPQTVQDGSFIDPTFTLTPVNGTPSSYSWSWSAPLFVGNNPTVTFTPSNAASTVTNRKWFANPNVACPSPPSVSIPPVSTDPYYNSVYTITGQGNYSGGPSSQASTTLTVNAFWNPGGTTAPPLISGGPQIGFNNSSNLWVVLNQGTIARNTPEVVIYVPIDSQFRAKTVAHENRHAWQYVSGMNSDLFTVSSLMAVLSPLTDTTQAGLSAQIAQAFNNWYAGQLAWVNIRRTAMEQDAHSVSDVIAPQYAYQWCQ